MFFFLQYLLRQNEFEGKNEFGMIEKGLDSKPSSEGSPGAKVESFIKSPYRIEEPKFKGRPQRHNQ